MSFLKYQEDEQIREGNGRGPLSFNRAHVDGMPFRGPSIPLKEEEYDTFTETVQDFGAKVFDISDAKEYAELKQIFDRASNNWYQIHHFDKQWGETDAGKKTVYVFVMWTIPHKELSKHRVQAELLPTPVPQQF